eukprot:5154194-Ditylum_brightwellii.AAC.1
MIFDQHPEKWRKAYIRAGNNLRNQSLAEIIQYMTNEKAFADAEDNQKKRKGNESKHGPKNKKQRVERN